VKITGVSMVTFCVHKKLKKFILVFKVFCSPDLEKIFTQGGRQKRYIMFQTKCVFKKPDDEMYIVSIEYAPGHPQECKILGCNETHPDPTVYMKIIGCYETMKAAEEMVKALQPFCRVDFTAGRTTQREQYHGIQAPANRIFKVWITPCGQPDPKQLMWNELRQLVVNHRTELNYCGIVHTRTCDE